MAHVPRLAIKGHLAPGPIVLDAEQSRRLSAVARVRPGDAFRAFSGDGREWRATVDAVTPKAVLATIHDVIAQSPPEVVVAEAWVSIVRPNRFDWAIEKCVEAGVDVIRPLITEHAARGEGSSVARQERWARIATEAAEQCGRLYLPVVEQPARLADLLNRPHGAMLFCDRDGRPWPAVSSLLPERGSIAVLVGPEGGWSDEERRLAALKGAIPLRLGPNILRTETASVVATALLRASAGAPLS
jgi:16S rRNA (uracil1498-N3)-methyltransferase